MPETRSTQPQAGPARHRRPRSRTPLFLLALLGAPLVAHAQWPSTITVFNDPNLPVESLGLAERGGEHWFVAETWDDVALTGEVWVKRHVPGSGLTSRSDVGSDPGGVRRLLTAGVHALPSIAIDDGTALNLSMKTDGNGLAFAEPTIENVAVGPVSLAPVVNPPELIDDDLALTSDRGRSWIDIDATLGDVWSCWTYHGATSDDVYCRARPTGMANLAWTDPILALATDPADVEDHPSVALQASTGRRVVAYHTPNGIQVRLFDLTMAEDLPNDVFLGSTANVNFPHLIDDDGVLHLIAVNTATDDLNYATCAIDCHIDANWSTETVDDLPAGGIAHPQIAVDGDGNVFVAFQHTPAAGTAADERVRVTAKCAVDGWDDGGGELVDDSESREQIGGNGGAKGLPAFLFDATNNRLSLAYVQAVGGVDRVGRWARKDATLAHADICAGQP